MTIDRIHYASLRAKGFGALVAALHARHPQNEPAPLLWEIAFPSGLATWIVEKEGQPYTVQASFDYDQDAPSVLQERYGRFTDRWQAGAIRNPHSVGQESRYCRWFIPAEDYWYHTLFAEAQQEGVSKSVADVHARQVIRDALVRASADDESDMEILDLVVTVHDAQGRRVGQEALGGIEVLRDLDQGDLHYLSSVARDLAAQILGAE